MAKEEPYPSALTEKEWKIVRPLLPAASKLGRPPRYGRRLLLEALLYVTRSGCTWRMMPREFPHWRLCYYYFVKWHEEGVWERINAALVARVRIKSGKKKSPRLRSSTARALRWLASAESVVSMQAKRLWGERDIFWLIPSD